MWIWICLGFWRFDLMSRRNSWGRPRDLIKVPGARCKVQMQGAGAWWLRWYEWVNVVLGICTGNMSSITCGCISARKPAISKEEDDSWMIGGQWPSSWTSLRWPSSWTSYWRLFFTKIVSRGEFLRAVTESRTQLVQQLGQTDCDNLKCFLCEGNLDIYLILIYKNLNT